MWSSGLPHSAHFSNSSFLLMGKLLQVSGSYVYYLGMTYSPEKQREYSKKHYEANKEMYNTKARKHNKIIRQRNREYVHNIKANTPCVDCGGQFSPYAMQFDHLFDKENDVSNLMRSCVSLERLQTEINKCEVVCANCHAVRTHEARQEASEAT